MIDQKASVDKAAFIAPDADVLGDAAIASDCGIWFHAVVRADLAPIMIGRGSNVQDCAVVHVDPGCPVTIGAGVTIGHGAIVHGCTIGDNTLVGMGAILLNGAAIGKNCVIGAGALVTQGTVVPDGTLMVGCPAKPVRAVRPEEIEHNRENAAVYVAEAAKYKKELGV